MAQAFAVYLVSGPHANMIGLYRLPLAYAALDLGHSEAAITKAMTTLSEAGYCHYDATTERVWVVEHLRHELGTERLQGRDKRLKGILRELDENAVSPLSSQLAAHYQLEWKGRPSEAPPKPLPSQEQGHEQGQEHEQERCCAASPEPRAASVPAVLVFPTVGAAPEWSLTADLVSDLAESFPDIDVLAECRKALGWCKTNSRNRKTPGGMPKFLFSWMGRAQNRGGRPARDASDPRGNIATAKKILQEFSNGTT